ncbi:MAG: AAA family ATPase [Magnetococcales bacterium]|nr:AAA family ATPase [Magnetococcales bacterium]
MIILRLKSENILCFHQLDLTDLPAQGRILITGPNESGKSALLEILAFALFGRTANLARNDLAKVIRWGADQGSATLKLRAPDQKRYTLTRAIDREGNHQATLGATDDQTTLALGTEAVDQKIQEWIGCDFQPFLDTLYLAQARHTRPGETIRALDGETTLNAIQAELQAEDQALRQQESAQLAQQAALRDEIIALKIQEDRLALQETALEQAANRVAAAQATVERWLGVEAGIIQATQRIATACDHLAQIPFASPLAEWRQRGQNLDAALRELESIDRAGHLAGIATPKNGVRQWFQRWQEPLNTLEKNIAGLWEERAALLRWLGELPPAPNDSPTLTTEREKINHAHHKALKRRARKGRRMGILLLLIPITWFAAGLSWNLWLQPRFGAQVAELLGRHLPGVPLTTNLVMMAVTALPALLLLCGLLGRGLAGKKVRAALAAKQALDLQVIKAWNVIDTIPKTAEHPLQEQVTLLIQLDRAPWSADLNRWTGTEFNGFWDETAWNHAQNQLQEQLQNLQAQLAPVLTTLRAKGEQARQEPLRLLDQVAQLQKEVEDERHRRHERTRILAAIAGIDGEKGQIHHAIEIRQVAEGLLQGASQELRLQFQQELNRVLGRLVPIFTRGRFHTLRLDEQWNITVLPEGHREPVEMVALSTGVKRQLALVLRVALSQALLARTPDSAFLALDEPFAHFDRQRSQEFLESLATIDPRIAQIWITAQEFADEALTASRHIDCGALRTSS